MGGFTKYFHVIANLGKNAHGTVLLNATVFNGDFLKKQEVDMTSNPINGRIASFQSLPATQLVEAYENDELKGKLKEIPTDLDEDSNPVIMVMKYKK